MELSLFNLLLVVLIAWLAGALVSRYGYPPVLGELAAGVIFGPPLLGLLHGDGGITLLGRLGVLVMMLYIGTQITPRQLREASGGAMAATITGFLVPFALGYLVTTALGYPTGAGLVVGTVIGTTALASVPRMLVDLDLLDSRVGRTLMGVALFSVAVVLTAFATVTVLVEAGDFQWGRIGRVLGQAILFLLIAVVAGRYLYPRLSRMMLAAGLAGRKHAVTLMLLIGIAMGALAEFFNLHIILGAFLAGLFLEEEMFEPGIFDGAADLMRDVAFGFMTPIFFVSAGFMVSLEIFQRNPLLLGLVVGVALAGKIVAGPLASLLSRQDWREGLLVGLGMNGRGGVDVVMANAALQMGIISQDLFTALIFTAFFTTLSVPILLKWGVAWLDQQAMPATEPVQEPALEEGSLS